jgi:hypothetical protein
MTSHQFTPVLPSSAVSGLKGCLKPNRLSTIRSQMYSICKEGIEPREICEKYKGRRMKIGDQSSEASGRSLAGSLANQSVNRPTVGDREGPGPKAHSIPAWANDRRHRREQWLVSVHRVDARQTQQLDADAPTHHRGVAASVKLRTTADSHYESGSCSLLRR